MHSFEFLSLFPCILFWLHRSVQCCHTLPLIRMNHSFGLCGYKIWSLKLTKTACYFLKSSYRIDDGDNKRFWNVGQILPDYRTKHPKRLSSSHSPTSEREISHRLRYLKAECCWKYLDRREERGSNIVEENYSVGNFWILPFIANC